MLTYREALRAFADGKTLEFFTGHWNKAEWVLARANEYAGLDSPSPYRIRQATIPINGVEVPEPLREAPQSGVEVFIPAFGMDACSTSLKWKGLNIDLRLLQRGFVHLTREAAEAHARALILASGGQV